jgi:ABC-type multidrug transport system permease subunit
MSHEWFTLAVGVAIGFGVVMFLAFICWVLIAFKIWHDS